MKNKIINKNDFLLYKDTTGEVKVNVLLINDDLWLTQDLIAELFGRERSVVTKHISRIFKDGELEEKSNVQKMHIPNSDKPVKIYNLNVIIAVGYRINSKQATNFRIWATKILKEYMKKGYALDDERLENSNNIFGEDYFTELLERIKNIRSSERRFYQKVTDIYATSIDYDKDSEITRTFYKTVQNKMHYAISHKTAAELIYDRVDANKKNIGLTTWKKAPKGPIYSYDVLIAKNYLTEKELKDLNRLVDMYLDYAEMQAEQHNPMTMNDWVNILDSFLKFTGKEILTSAGKISHDVAKTLALKEYEKYRKKQDKLYVSDFDKLLEKELEYIALKKD